MPKTDLLTPTKTLVIGGSGQIGEHYLHAVPEAVGTFCSHSRGGLLQLDITDRRAVNDVVRSVKPDVIVLPACNAHVDYCETSGAETYATNVGGVRNTVDAANHVGAKVVYVSSDYVFDGIDGPYTEDVPVNPICVFGAQKVAAEHYVAAFASDWLIVRTSVVYSWESQGKNFLYRLRRALLRGEQIKVPSDQVGTPTYAPDFVHATLGLVEAGVRGVYNVCGSRTATRHDFAVAAAQEFGLSSELVIAVSTADLGQKAPRPLRAGLVSGKVEDVLGRPMLDYFEGLRRMAMTGDRASALQLTR